MGMKQKTITLKNGVNIEQITLRNKQGMEVEILTLGGIIKSIKAPDREGKLENILLEYEDINTYIENEGYINALIGRVAGRINQGEFTLDGVKYKINRNEGKNTLHGGIEGFDKKIWKAQDKSTEETSAVELLYFSPDGEEGFPGNLEVKVMYTLHNDNTFNISYEAVSDKDTLVSLTSHSYFNLSGNAKRSITDHEMMIKSSSICELDAQNIATGNTLDVDEHPVFDFRTPKKVGQDLNEDHIQLKYGSGYDHPWILDQGKECAVLYDQVSGRQLEVSTDQEIVVVYIMNNKHPARFTNGEKDLIHYGVNFETQGYPVGYNEAFKEHNILHANEKYVQKTKWKFTTR